MPDSTEDLKDVKDMQTDITRSEALERADDGLNLEDLNNEFQEKLQDVERVIAITNRINEKMKAAVADSEAFEKGLTKWYDDFKGEESSKASLEHLTELYDMVTNGILPQFDELAKARAELGRNLMGRELDFEFDKGGLERIRNWLIKMLRSQGKMEELLLSRKTLTPTIDPYVK
ncbi:hypothetical protein FRB94_010191 [Tulasnella sp. JGI-2019a]|nr:hypothetical protein FRB94_010191 [Tulasnella sp. JGI-2019a]